MDVSHYMHKEKMLQKGIRLANMICMEKMAYNPNHEVGLVVFGCEGKLNPVSLFGHNKLSISSK